MFRTCLVDDRTHRQIGSTIKKSRPQEDVPDDDCAQADHIGIVLSDEGTGGRKHQIGRQVPEAERQLLAQRQLIFVCLVQNSCFSCHNYSLLCSVLFTLLLNRFRQRLTMSCKQNKVVKLQVPLPRFLADLPRRLAMHFFK